MMDAKIPNRDLVSSLYGMVRGQPSEPDSLLQSVKSVNWDKGVIISSALRRKPQTVTKEQAAALDTDAAVRSIGIVQPSVEVVSTEFVKYWDNISGKSNGPPTPKRIKLISSAQWNAEKSLCGKLPYRLVPVRNPSSTRITIDIPEIKIKEFHSEYIQRKMVMVSPDTSVPARRVTLISKADPKTGKLSLGMYRLIRVLPCTTGTPQIHADGSRSEDEESNME